MKKHSKKKNKLTVIILSFIVFSAGMLIIFLINKTSELWPVYKVESRIENISQYTNKNDQIETVAWIRVQGTNIDYPVINNNNSVDIGEIIEDFTWMQGEVEKLPNKLFILGHNIRNVSSTPLITDKTHTRFEQLLSYIYYDFVKENKYIQYTMDGNDYLYKIFSVSMVKDHTLDYVSKNYTKEKMKEYIHKSIEDSYFTFDIEVDENDKIISLITCTRFFGVDADYTFKIDGRMVRENELINNYKVEKNKNYEQIEKIIRGDKNEQKV